MRWEAESPRLEAFQALERCWVRLRRGELYREPHGFRAAWTPGDRGGFLGERAVCRRIARRRLAGFYVRQRGEAQPLRSGSMHCRRCGSQGLLPGSAVPLLLGRRLRPVRGRLDRDAIGFRRPLAEIDRLAALRAEGPPRVVRRPWCRLPALRAVHDPGLGMPSLASHGAYRLQKVRSKSTEVSAVLPRSGPLTCVNRMLSAYLLALTSGTQA